LGDGFDVLSYHRISTSPMAPHPDDPSLSVRDRLLRAAARLDGADHEGASCASSELREDQATVFRAVGWYVTDVATRPAGMNGKPFARIVLPPRTGKTVLAAHVIGQSGLCATIVVPSRTLVRQTCKELRAHLPGIRVGRFDGEQVKVVRKGVNVTTYAMLHARTRNRPLPKPISTSPLVFVDEAHHAMTDARMAIFRDAFHPDAIRIGLTATPDYDALRALEKFFPDLIHEIALDEAMELGLLAPARVWVAEVDEDASKVQMVGGDFDTESLGRLLSSAPAFEAVRQFRYALSERRKAAMIACANRQQAYDLVRYLERHRPRGTPPPLLLLGETPRAQREESLSSFETGACDTLIQVGVLVEGWTSPRCKVLVDLAPSVSRVRATQKYFRAMTRDGNEEAHLFVVLPRHLPAPPVLPMEVFGQVGEYDLGDLVRKRVREASEPRQVRRYEHTPIRGVELKRRIVVATTLSKPSLQRGDWESLAEVLATCEGFDFDAPPTLDRFRWLVFAHKAFSGHGAFLLRWLGFAASRSGYAAFLVGVFPDADGLLLLGERDRFRHNGPCSDDAAHLLSAIHGDNASAKDRDGILEGMRALAGTEDAPAPTPYDALESAETCAWVLLSAITALPARYRVMLSCGFGLGTWDELSMRAAGGVFSYTGTTMRHRSNKALRLLRERRLLFERIRPRNGVNSPQGTPEESHELTLAQRPISTAFLAAVVGELSHLELAAGDLESLWGTAENRRRSRQSKIPPDINGWVQDIARALQYAKDVRRDESRDYDLGALLAAVVVRACLHRLRPRMTNEEMLALLSGIPEALLLRDGDVRSVALEFARWYLDTHVALGLMRISTGDSAWMAACDLGTDIVDVQVAERWSVEPVVALLTAEKNAGGLV